MVKFLLQYPFSLGNGSLTQLLYAWHKINFYRGLSSFGIMRRFQQQSRKISFSANFHFSAIERSFYVEFLYNFEFSAYFVLNKAWWV